MDQVNEPDLTFSRAISVTSRGNILRGPTFVSTYITQRLVEREALVTRVRL